jgi:probable rRNA maturation factor
VATVSLARRLRSSIDLIPVAPYGKQRPVPAYVEISLLSSEEIGRVHGEFLDDPTPTDVITFDHGEILVCPDVAKEQGAGYGRTLNEEVLLYGIHGLLHLRGWSDKTLAKRREMATAQEKVWRRVRAL